VREVAPFGTLDKPAYLEVRSVMILAKSAAAARHRQHKNFKVPGAADAGPLALGLKGKYHASPSPHSARHNRLIMSPSRKRRAKSDGRERSARNEKAIKYLAAKLKKGILKK
jgi:hypothetical protein